MGESKDTSAAPASEPPKADKSPLEEALQPLVTSADDDSSMPLTSDVEKGIGGGGNSKANNDSDIDGVNGVNAGGGSTIFNRGERPVQDALFGKIFLGGLVVLLVREVCVFFWAVLRLRLLDPASFTVQPLLSITLGLGIAVPACFFLLWALRNCRKEVVQAFLVLCLVLFLLTLLFHTLHSPPPAGSEDPEDHMMPGGEDPSPGGLGGGTLPFPSHHTVGALGDESESTMLEAAIPTSFSRILLGSSSAISKTPSSSGKRFTGSSNPLRRDSSVVRRHLSNWHSLLSPAVRRGLRAAASAASSAASKWAPLHSAVLRRRLTSFMEQHHLLKAEGVLNSLVNAGGVLLVLLYCQDLLALPALVIRDATKFILTRGRGLVFAPIAVVAAGVVLAFPGISTALQVVRACHSSLEHEPLSSVPGDSNGAQAEADRELCHAWGEALFMDPLAGPFIALGLFLAAWLFSQVKNSLQFMAAHVVAQFYGSSRVSMEEDDIHTVWAAAKCAFHESFGTLALLSLVSTAAIAASITINLVFIFGLGSSALAAVPLVLNSMALFAFGIFLDCFVIPVIAVTGQSFRDAVYSAFDLVQRNLVPAAAFTVSTLCVVGVISFGVLLVSAIAAIFGAVILTLLGAASGFAYPLWLAMIFIVSGATAAFAITLFHWIYSTTISSTFVYLAMEGRAKGDLTTTPLGIEG